MSQEHQTISGLAANGLGQLMPAKNPASEVPQAETPSADVVGRLEREIVVTPEMDTRPSVLKALNAKHLRIADLYLGGKSVDEIGAEMGLRPTTIRLLTRQPLFQDYVARRREQQRKSEDELKAGHLVLARQRIEEAAVQAVETQVSLLGSQDESIRLRSSAEILEMAFGGEAVKDLKSQQNQMNINVLGEDALKNFMSALVEAGFVKPKEQPATTTTSPQLVEQAPSV